MNIMREKLGAFIVPTGIGASIGGYAGDASVWARKFCEFSRLIVNPNVVNAGCFSGITENMLYVEGYSLDEFFKGNLSLTASKNNRVGVVLDRGISQDVLNIHINTINAVKTVYGIDVIYKITDKPVAVEFFVDESGASTGTVKDIENLLVTSKELIKEGADAIAVVCKFSDEVQNEEYENGIGVDPIGGVEAIISHYLSKELCVPVAHSPAFEDYSISTKLVNPKASAEYITPTFLPCILIGLNQAPLLREERRGKREEGKRVLCHCEEGVNDLTLTKERSCHCEERGTSDAAIQKEKESKVGCVDSINSEFDPNFAHESTDIELTINDLDYLVMPFNSLGSAPVFECVNRGIKVFAVKENESVLGVTKDALLLDGVIEVENYEQCLGLIK